MTSTAVSRPLRPSPTAKKAAFAAFIGTAVEWYDFYAYSTAAALVFSTAFFPATTDLIVGLFGAFAAYGVGFFARPVGGVIAGHLGDTLGRKLVLVYSLLLMGLGTLLVGFLPTYAQVGAWAPVLLVVLRLLQGLASGAEWGGASLLAVEQGDSKNRGLLGSLSQIGSAAGMLLAAGAFAIVQAATGSQFIVWGWRIPFLASVVLVIIGILVRLRIDEPIEFAEVLEHEKTHRLPVVTVIREDWRGLLVTIGLRLVQPAVYSIVTTWFLVYISLRRGETVAGTQAVIIASAAAILTTPLWGALSDRIGRKKLGIFAIVGEGLLIWPLFLFLTYGDLRFLPLVLAIVLAVFDAAIYAPGAAWFAEQFPTKVRYSGVSIGYQVGTLLSGGLTPIIATALFALGGGSPWLIAAFISVYAVLSLVAALKAKDPVGEARKRSRRRQRSGGVGAQIAEPAVTSIEVPDAN